MKVIMKRPPARLKRWVLRLVGIEPIKEKTKIRIDDWDTWSADYTLAQIIYPLLVRFKELNIGYPTPGDVIDREDVNYNNGNSCVDEECWDLILDELIWTFKQLQDEDSDNQFYFGEVDFQFKPLNEKDNNGKTLYALERGPNDTFQVDEEGLRQHYDRIQNGLRLFGKYYQHLWW